MIRWLLAAPVVALLICSLAWASAPVVAAMAPAVADGAGDALRGVGWGCGVALALGGVTGCILAGGVVATERQIAAQRAALALWAVAQLDRQVVDATWYVPDVARLDVGEEGAIGRDRPTARA